MVNFSYSVVIVTFGRHEILCDTLRALASHIDPVVGELIVVDQCPSDPLPEDVLAIPGLRYLVLDTPGMVPARNTGLQWSKGDIVIFLDDDVVPRPRLIQSHLLAYADPNVGAVAGRILDLGQTDAPLPHPRVFDPIDGWLYAHFDHVEPGNVMTARGCNMSFRRDVLNHIGGFDPYIRIFRDDTDACLSLLDEGFRVRFVPEAELIHLNAATGGTREGDVKSSDFWNREWKLYQKHFIHYRDNLYFLLKHFRSEYRLKRLFDAHRTYVGRLQSPFRFLVKNLCFVVALIAAAKSWRFRQHHPLQRLHHQI